MEMLLLLLHTAAGGTESLIPPNITQRVCGAVKD